MKNIFPLRLKKAQNFIEIKKSSGFHRLKRSPGSFRAGKTFPSRRREESWISLNSKREPENPLRLERKSEVSLRLGNKLGVPLTLGREGLGAAREREEKYEDGSITYL